MSLYYYLLFSIYYFTSCNTSMMLNIMHMRLVKYSSLNPHSNSGVLPGWCEFQYATLLSLFLIFINFIIIILYLLYHIIFYSIIFTYLIDSYQQPHYILLYIYLDIHAYYSSTIIFNECIISTYHINVVLATIIVHRMYYSNIVFYNIPYR